MGMPSFKDLGQAKQMFDNYRKLDKELKNLIIRSKEGKFIQNNGEEGDQVVIDISGEMKIKDIHINDDALLNPSRKSELESLLMNAIKKAQEKSQEIVTQKTKDILGVDPSALSGMLGGLGGN